MSALLSEERINTELQALSNWQQDGTAIVRKAALPSFPDAITAVDRIAELAERADHHPDIDIRWRNLKFSCSTHSEGGITDKDINMARSIDGVLAEFVANG